MFQLRSEEFQLCNEKFQLRSEEFQLCNEKFWLYSEEFQLCNEKFWLYSEDLQLQGDFFDCALGIGVWQGLFWNLRGHQRLLCTPKNGRKLLLGKKHTILGFRASQEASCQIREFQDLSNLALFPVCLKMISSSHMEI